MPTLTIINDGTVIETSAAVSILNALLRNGTDIQHRCGGKAVCGTCRVRIVDGAKFLSPMRCSLKRVGRRGRPFAAA